MDSQIPTISTAWQLWYGDIFDRDVPASVQARGADIVQGLYELWQYTLKEGIDDNGTASFSRFYLTWGNTSAARVDVAVQPFNNLSLLKLRRWAGLMSQSNPVMDKQRDTILWRLAQAHYDLLLKSIRWQTSEIDCDAEAIELLAYVESIQDSDEL